MHLNNITNVSPFFSGLSPTMVDCLTPPKLGRGTGLPERVNVTTPKPVESPLTKRLGRMIMGTRHHPYGLFKCHHSHARHLQQPFLNTILVYRYISIYIYIYSPQLQKPTRNWKKHDQLKISSKNEPLKHSLSAIGDSIICTFHLLLHLPTSEFSVTSFRCSINHLQHHHFWEDLPIKNHHSI